MVVSGITPDAVKVATVGDAGDEERRNVFAFPGPSRSDVGGSLGPNGKTKEKYPFPKVFLERPEDFLQHFCDPMGQIFIQIKWFRHHDGILSPVVQKQSGKRRVFFFFQAFVAQIWGFLFLSEERQKTRFYSWFAFGNGFFGVVSIFPLSGFVFPWEPRDGPPGQRDPPPRGEVLFPRNRRWLFPSVLGRPDPLAGSPTGWKRF